MFDKFLAILFLVSVRLFNVESAYCHYERDIFSQYKCVLTNENVLTENDMLNIRGEHLANYGNENVTSVTVSNITIQVFPSLIIDQFINLEAIYLDAKNVKSFGSPITNCLSLGYIFMSHNDISTIPGSIFQNCINLLTISLMNNSISNIDENAFVGLSSIMSLIISHNRITSLQPNIFASLSSLLNLYISNNEIQEIKPEIFSYLPSLSILDLRANKITSWNSTFLANNQKLRHLDLSGNQIQSIDGNAFANLPNLRTLSIGSLLTQVPVLASLGQLENLYLNKNEIKEVSTESFKSLVNLKDLDLSENLIGSIDFSMRPEKILSKLERLNLKLNNISVIQDNAFSMLESLTDLNLAGNELEILQEKSIRPIDKMKRLEISFNKINKMEKKLFDGVDSLQLLSEGNVCFNGTVIIRNMQDMNNFKDTVTPLLKDCFNTASTKSINLIMQIVTALALMTSFLRVY